MYGSNKLAHKQYTNVQISTIDRGRLLIMLYEGCIKFLKHAKAGLENKDIAKFARLLSKAQAIISELMLTLDFERGGDIARDLDRLYDFMLFYLTEANLEKNPAKIQRVIDLLEVVAGAYRQIIEGDNPEAREAIASNTAAIGGARPQAPTPAPAAGEQDASTEKNNKEKGKGLEPLPGSSLRVSF